MKKAISILLVLVMCLTMCACSAYSNPPEENPNENKYQEATSMLNSGHYERAIVLFEELANSNYKDSAQKVNEAKFQFVLELNDGENPTVYKYLQQLVAANYKNSSEVFEQLYAWEFEIAFSRMANFMYHEDTLQASTKASSCYYINFQITGGEPGEHLSGQYEIRFSDGQTIKEGFGDGDGMVLSLFVSADETPLGQTTFTLYDDYGNVLATKSAYIK